MNIVIALVALFFLVYVPIWTLVQVLRQPDSYGLGNKTTWTILVLVLNVVGVGLYYGVGVPSLSTEAHTHPPPPRPWHHRETLVSWLGHIAAFIAAFLLIPLVPTDFLGLLLLLLVVSGLFVWVPGIIQVLRLPDRYGRGTKPGWAALVLLVPAAGAIVYYQLGVPTLERDGPPVTPPWRDIGILRIFSQVALIVALAGVARYLFTNLVDNLEALGIETGFDFLDQPAGFSVADNPFKPAQPIRDVILVGIKNTFLVALVGCVLTTILGTIIGVARLSQNWLVRQAATVYVETIRNIPPLLIIVFMFLALTLPLPEINNASTPLNLFVISNRKLAVPSVIARDNAAAFLVLLVVALALATVTWLWRTRVFNETGRTHHRMLWAIGVFVVISVSGYALLGGPYDISRPRVNEAGLNVIGGFGMLGSYFALTVALVIYTASHVAEIVRGSIQAVPRGQTEAGEALALSSFQRLRFVVLPQAARIAIPPTINQYLNLTKNTSLAAAIAFPEITRITTTYIGNANPAPQAILILMAVYLSFSLTISVVVNIANRRAQLVTN